MHFTSVINFYDWFNQTSHFNQWEGTKSGRKSEQSLTSQRKGADDALGGKK